MRHDLISAVFEAGETEDDLVRLMARVAALAAFHRLRRRRQPARRPTGAPPTSSASRRRRTSYEPPADPSVFAQDEERR